VKPLLLCSDCWFLVTNSFCSGFVPPRPLTGTQYLSKALTTLAMKYSSENLIQTPLRAGTTLTIGAQMPSTGRLLRSRNDNFMGKSRNDTIFLCRTQVYDATSVKFASKSIYFYCCLNIRALFWYLSASL
jgi:hypothetical protein